MGGYWPQNSNMDYQLQNSGICMYTIYNQFYLLHQMFTIVLPTHFPCLILYKLNRNSYTSWNHWIPCIPNHEIRSLQVYFKDVALFVLYSYWSIHFSSYEIIIFIHLPNFLVCFYIPLPLPPETLANFSSFTGQVHAEQTCQACMCFLAEPHTQ